jgi:hypothetical protein
MNKTIETDKLAALRTERDRLLSRPLQRYSAADWANRDELNGLNWQIGAEEKAIADAVLEARTAEWDAKEAARAAEQKRISNAKAAAAKRTGRVVFEVTADWLEITDRGGELSYAVGTLEEQFAAERIAGIGHRDWEEPRRSTRVKEINPRHTAIHVGDLLVATSAHGYTTGAWFVRLDKCAGRQD